MAILGSNLTYNYGEYSSVYFRLVTHLTPTGETTNVDAFMYPSSEAFASGSAYIACLPFAVSNVSASLDNVAVDVVNKNLYYVTQKVVESLEESYPTSTFTITGIPTE
jgi:hypothetical protein